MKKTNESELPIRQLIKFSNYSLCITLPKDFVDNLGWQQGDRIAFQLTKDNLVLSRQILPTSLPSQEIFIKDEITQEIEKPKPEITISENTEEITLSELDNLEPIPQLN